MITVLITVVFGLLGFCGSLLGTESCSLKEPSGAGVLTEEKFPSHVDLSSVPVSERKRAFIELMVPLIERANEEVLRERKFLLRVLSKSHLTLDEEKELARLVKKYRASNVKDLLLKVDAVPVSLVLAQAAIESGWGTSRFFREGNNVFGMYAFKGGKCLKAKESGACLKVYDNLYDSVRDYIYNLNVGWAYERFRKLRAEGADVFTLIETLEAYSTERERYVKLLKSVIKNNSLDSYDAPEFAFKRRK